MSQTLFDATPCDSSVQSEEKRTQPNKLCSDTCQEKQIVRLASCIALVKLRLIETAKHAQHHRPKPATYAFSSLQLCHTDLNSMLLVSWTERRTIQRNGPVSHLFDDGTRTFLFFLPRSGLADNSRNIVSLHLTLQKWLGIRSNSPNSSSKIQVSWHDSHSLRVNGTEICVCQKVDKKIFCWMLQSLDSVNAPSQRMMKCRCDALHQSGEGQSSN